jgi:hypothetical protein
MARCGDVGDELGSRLVAARLIEELMQKQYWPYAKWFGTAFSKLACAGRTGVKSCVYCMNNYKSG